MGFAPGTGDGAILFTGSLDEVGIDIGGKLMLGAARSRFGRILGWIGDGRFHGSLGMKSGVLLGFFLEILLLFDPGIVAKMEEKRRTRLHPGRLPGSYG